MFFNFFRKKPKKTLQRWHFPLTEFIAVLKNEKFSIGVDTHILMHQIIRQFNLPEQLNELSDYLAPIVAQSAEEQEKFSEYFNRWFFIEEIQKTEKQNKQNKQDKQKKQGGEIGNNKQEKEALLENTYQQKQENQKAVLNIEKGMLPKQGLSFAILPTKLEFQPEILRQFRQWRFMSETDKLFFDIDTTVKQITQKGETAEPVYKHKRKHHEYLIIAEQDSYKNHLAQFIKTIYKTLLKNNIDVRLFTFDTDPRILYAENNNKKYTINQVFALYGDAVLLYFGSTSLWFNTQDLQIYNWTKILTRWQRRYWFPLNSPDNWHLFEQTGTRIFPNILPVDFNAFEILTKHITSNKNEALMSAKYWTENINYALTNINTKLPLETIALFFSPLHRAWIAACAVYPELNWDLTLELGKYISPKDNNLSTAENILQLLRLDWFRKGYMPPEIRFALLNNWLPQNMNTMINAHIVELMEQDTRIDTLKKQPAFRMQLAVHKLLAETNEQKRKKIAENLANEIKQSGAADFVALQYINETELSPVFFAIPEELVALFENIIGKSLKTKKQTSKKTEKNYTEKVGNTAFEMIYVKGGTFNMGSNEDVREKPIHKVSVDDFYIGEKVVTVNEYMVFANETNSHFPEWMEKGSEYNVDTGTDEHYKNLGDALKNGNNPIVGVSWLDATAYCKWLSDKTTGKSYRLPTEAEWEYAAGGGASALLSNRNKWAGTKNENKLGDYAWYGKNSDSKTHVVGDKLPNELKLYDMSGNVWEWCNDWYNEDYYKNSPKDNPQGAKSGSSRVMRGGGWSYDADGCRVAFRSNYVPVNRISNGGFRLARSY